MAHPNRRVAPTGSRGNTYSPLRLKLVLFLLTAATLPVVIGSSVLIYYYLRFSVMVERRLQGERWLIPARLYARPLVLRTGMALGAADLVKIKVMRSGGLHRARKVCAVAEAAGLPVIVGSGHESGIGVAAELHLAVALRAIPYAGEMVGHLRLVEDLIEPSIEVTNGSAAPPEGPGLGVALASAGLERFDGGATRGI